MARFRVDQCRFREGDESLDRFRSAYLGQSPIHARQVRKDQRELWVRGGKGSDEVR
jgi:hypothetical protein